jgi:NitT/TauT family transport system permease protein
MRSADPAARELFASVDATRWEVLWHLRLPAALPSIFTTARFAVALGLAAAYFSEGTSLGLEGLGVIGRRAALDQTSGAEVLWTTIFCTAALGIAGLVALTTAERLFLRWHASQRT